METDASDRAAAAARARKQLAKRRKAAHAAAGPAERDAPLDPTAPPGAPAGAPAGAPPAGPPRGPPRTAPAIPAASTQAADPPAPDAAPVAPPLAPPPAAGPRAGRRAHTRTASVVAGSGPPPAAPAAPATQRPSRLSGFWSAVGGIANDVASDLAHLAAPAPPAQESQQAHPRAHPPAESEPAEQALPPLQTGADVSSLFGSAPGTASAQSGDSASLFAPAPAPAPARPDAPHEAADGARAASPAEEPAPADLPAGTPNEAHDSQAEQQTEPPPGEYDYAYTQELSTVAEGYEGGAAGGVQEEPQYAPVQYDEQGQAYDANGQPLAIEYDEQGQAYYPDARYDEQGQAYAPIYPAAPQELQPEFYPVQWDEQGLAYDYEGQPLPAEQDEQGQLYYPQLQYDEQGQAFYAVYPAQPGDQVIQDAYEAMDSQIEGNVVESAFAQEEIPGGADAAYPSDQVSDNIPDFAGLAIPPTEGHGLSPVPEDQVPEDEAPQTEAQNSSGLFGASAPSASEQPVEEQDPSTLFGASTADKLEERPEEHIPNSFWGAPAGGEPEQPLNDREPAPSAIESDQKGPSTVLDQQQESQDPSSLFGGPAEATQDPSGLFGAPEANVQDFAVRPPETSTPPAASAEAAPKAESPPSARDPQPASGTETTPDPSSLFSSSGAARDANDLFDAPAGQSWPAGANGSPIKHPARQDTQDANGLFGPESAGQPSWLSEADDVPSATKHSRQDTQDAGGLFGTEPAGQPSWLGVPDVASSNAESRQDTTQDANDLFAAEPTGPLSWLGEPAASPEDRPSLRDSPPGQTDSRSLVGDAKNEHRASAGEEEAGAASEPAPEAEAAPAAITESEHERPVAASIPAAQSHTPMPSADASSLFASGGNLFGAQAPSKPVWAPPRPSPAATSAQPHKAEDAAAAPPQAQEQKEEQPAAAGLFGSDSHDSFAMVRTKSALQDGPPSLAASQPADSEGSPVMVPRASSAAELVNGKSGGSSGGELAERFARAEAQISDLQTQLTRQAQVVVDADAKTAEMEQERDGAREELAQHKKKHEAALVAAQQASEPVQQELAATKARLQAAEAERDAARAEALASSARVSELSASETHSGTIHAAVKHELDLVLARQAQLESELAKAESATAEAEASLSHAHRDLAQAHGQVARLQSEVESLTAERTELQSQIDAGSDQGDLLQRAQAQVDQLRTELQDAHDQLAAARAETEQQRQAAQESRAQWEAATSASAQAQEEWASKEASHTRDLEAHTNDLAQAQQDAEEHKRRVDQLEKDLAERATQGQDEHVAEVARLRESAAHAKAEAEALTTLVAQLKQDAEEQASKQHAREEELAAQLAEVQTQLREAERRADEGSRQPLADLTEAQGALAEARAEAQAARDMVEDLRVRLADTDDLRAEMEEMAEDHKRAIQLAEGRIQQLEAALRERDEHDPLHDAPPSRALLDRPHHRRSATASPAGVAPRPRRGLHAITDPVDLPAAQRHRRAESLSMLKARIGEEAPPSVPAVTLSPPAGEPRGSNTLLKGSLAQPSGQDPFHYCSSCTGDLIIV